MGKKLRRLCAVTHGPSGGHGFALFSDCRLKARRRIASARGRQSPSGLDCLKKASRLAAVAFFKQPTSARCFVLEFLRNDLCFSTV
jgi:hypothetical protein